MAIIGMERLVDTQQTKQIGRMPQVTKCHTVAVYLEECHTSPSVVEKESKGVMGLQPTNFQVNRFEAATFAAEYFISRMLPIGWREVFQYARIIDIGNTIYRNDKVYGLGFSIGI
jgi:hypothetical protein